MPSLLDRLRGSRLGRATPHRAARSHPPLRHDWIYWSCVAGIVVLLVGLYFWVTTARILKEPLRLEYGPLDPAFVSGFGPLVGAEFTRGNSVRTLVNGAQFFPAMVVDRALVTVGSANFDNRSFSINDEVTLNVLDPAVAAEHDRIFARDLARCTPVDPQEFARRPWWQRAAERFAGMFRSQL